MTTPTSPNQRGGALRGPRGTKFIKRTRLAKVNEWLAKHGYGYRLHPTKGWRFGAKV